MPNHRSLAAVIASALLAFVAATSAVAWGAADKATPPDAKELAARYKAKLEKAFLQKLTWHQEFKLALKDSKEKKLPVIAFFTRSDRQWPPSEELENEELLSEWWVSAGPRFVAYVNVWSGLPHPEDAVSREFVGKEQLPIFVVTDEQGRRISRFRLNDPSDLERALGGAEELFSARQEVAKPGESKVAKARLSLLEGMCAEKPNLRELDKVAGTKGLDVGLVNRYRLFSACTRASIVLAEMSEQIQRGYESGTNEQFAQIEAEAAAKMYKLYRDGVRIHERNRDTESVHRQFWDLTFEGALAHKDKQVATQALEAFENSYGGDEGGAKHVEEMKQKLAALRSGAPE